MTKEENYRIFRDLCKRIPYGVKVCAKYGDEEFEEEFEETLVGLESHLGKVAIPGATIYTDRDRTMWYYNQDMPKPFLRSIDKITDEEKKELDEIDWCKTDESFDDWLNRHHFDSNLLIEDGLAIEAPDWMYEIKENMYDIKYNWNER